MVSMIVPTMARTPLVGYRLVVLALLGTGFLSFGLWVHHMFATGIPHMSLGFFSAASMAVAIPSGIQVFAWIATLAAGKRAAGDADAVRARLPVHLRARRADRRHGRARAVRLAGARHLLRRRAPALRADRRHGVPAVRGDLLLGAVREQARAVRARSAAGCSGSCSSASTSRSSRCTSPGSPACRGASTPIPPGLGWDALNLVSTVGAFMIAAGVALFLFDLARNFRFAVGRQRRQRLERRHARVAADRTLLACAASRRDEPRAAVGRPEARDGRRGRRALTCRARRPAGARRSSRSAARRDARSTCCS